MSEVCSYSTCKKKNTEACVGCCRNNLLEDLFDDGHNIVCSSLICAFNKINGKCSMKIGEGSVSNCEKEEMPF